MGIKNLGSRFEEGLKKLVLSKIFWTLFLGFAFFFPVVRSMNRELPKELPHLFTLPKYELINEHGDKFGQKDLDGKVYIAGFIFTRCPTLCPKLMKKFSNIQKRVRGLGEKVALISVTVDPEHDSPRILSRYSRQYKANNRIWRFLTGDRDTIKDLVVNHFRLPMSEGDELMAIAHSEKLVLVDQKGEIRGYYSTSKDGINKLMIDVGLLVNNISRERMNGDKI